MFLSRIELSPRRRQARRMLGSPQVMHAMVMAACSRRGAHPTTTDEGRVLWRVDAGSFGYHLYVVSPQAPDFTQIAQEAAPPGNEQRTANYDPFLARLKQGDVWAFRLTANPTRSVTCEGQSRGKRVGCVTAAQQAAWLLERSQRHGFSLIVPDAVAQSAVDTAQYGDGDEAECCALDGLVVRRENPVFRRQNPAGGGWDHVTISRVTFQGVLRVNDVEVFRHALTHGIGASKGHGCGLLTLAPVRA